MSHLLPMASAPSKTETHLRGACARPACAATTAEAANASEEARQKQLWIKFFLASGNVERARELGWNGVEAFADEQEEAEAKAAARASAAAASLVQARVRGAAVRRTQRDLLERSEREAAVKARTLPRDFKMRMTLLSNEAEKAKEQRDVAEEQVRLRLL